MSILNTKFPDKVKFNGTKIDVHAGEDISPALNQTFEWIRLKERMITSTHTYIAMIEAGFDIETTTTDKGAFMYKWQLVFGEYLFSGRTWTEFCTTMEAIQRAYQFGTTSWGRGKKKQKEVRTFILWIANAGYEFQFYSHLKWHNVSLIQKDSRGNSDVFADSLRKPLKVMLSFTGSEYNSAITVYDALKFSNSLAQLAKDYCLTTKKKTKLPDGTVVSDLDYSIPRNSMTPLDPEKEEPYCDADVEILYEWSHYYLEAYVRQNGFAPMTSTGIIRFAVTESYDAIADRTMYNETLSMHPTFGEYYRIMKYLYRGGFTYANRAKAGHVLTDVVGKDFTSSYPASALRSTEFPVTEFIHKDITCEEDLEKLSDKAWYADFEFTHIIQSRGISVENAYKLHEWKTSASQCRDETGAVYDNGKIAYAKKITVTLTKQDFDVYKRFYKWHSVKISKVMVAEQGPLPAWFTDTWKHYYRLKYQLKLTAKGSAEYSLSKAICNGFYGLTVTKQHTDTINFDPDSTWTHKVLHFDNVEEQEAMSAMYEKAIGRDKRSMAINDGKPKVVLSPYWGIYITAISRRNILLAIEELGTDFVYCDTDSVYYQNEDAHEAYFQKWNQEVHDYNDLHLQDPAFHTLGDFDPVELDENEAPDCYRYHFLTLGAKRYLKWEGSALHATVAGLPHGALLRYAKEAVGDDKSLQIQWAVEHFKDGLKIAAKEAMKHAHTYIDEPVDDIVTDLHGNTEYMHEESCIVIFPIEFTIKIPDTYKEIMGISEEEFLLKYCYQKIAETKERF